MFIDKSILLDVSPDWCRCVETYIDFINENTNHIEPNIPEDIIVDIPEDVSIHSYKNTTEAVMRIIIIHKLTGRKFIYELRVPLFILDGIMCINKLPKIKEDIYVRDKFVILKMPEFIKKNPYDKMHGKMQEMYVSVYNLLNDWVNSADKESSENIKYELSDKFTVTQEPFGELSLSKFLNDYYKNIKE